MLPLQLNSCAAARRSGCMWLQSVGCHWAPSQQGEEETITARQVLPDAPLGFPGNHSGRPVSGAPPPSKKLCRPRPTGVSKFVDLHSAHISQRAHATQALTTLCAWHSHAFVIVSMWKRASERRTCTRLCADCTCSSAPFISRDALSDALPRLTQPHECAGQLQAASDERQHSQQSTF